MLGDRSQKLLELRRGEGKPKSTTANEASMREENRSWKAKGNGASGGDEPTGAFVRSADYWGKSVADCLRARDPTFTPGRNCKHASNKREGYSEVTETG